MEKPLITLTAKHFLSGVSGNDYGGYGGIFKQALGVSAIRSIGNFYTTASLGLLQAGPSGSSGGSGVIVDTPVVGVRNAETTSASYLYILGSSGHVYKKDNTTGAPTDIGATQQVVNPANGIGIFQPAGGTKYLYYAQQAQIGRVAVTSAPANRTSNSTTGASGDPWKDNWKTGLQSTNNHPFHLFLDALWFGNDYYIGKIQDDGAGAENFSLTALDFPTQYQVTALEDDGQYLVAAITQDKSSALSQVGSKVIFWDTTSSSWQFEFPVMDTIVALKRIGNVVYGLGARGVYTVSVSGGVKKVWQKGTSVTNGGSTRIVGPGMLSSFNDALVIGGDNGEVAFLGKPDPVLPAGYHTPIVVDAGITAQVSFIDAEFQNSNIIVGDNSTALKLYPMIYTANQQATGLSAETAYLALDQPYEITHIDVILGRVFASGDSITLQVMQNDGATYTTYGPNGGATTYADQGARRRLRHKPNAPVICEDLKLKLTFTAGVVAVRKICVYGNTADPMKLMNT